MSAAPPAPAAGLAPGAVLQGYQRTIEVGESAVDVQLHYGSGTPGIGLSGVGILGTDLPGHGRLVFSLPHLVGSEGELGTAEVAASYDLAPAGWPLPKLAVTALVDLPTAPGSRGAHPGLKATAVRDLGLGPLEPLRVESELRTEGPDLALSYRAAVGTGLRLGPATELGLELAALRPPTDTAAPREEHAQLRLTQQLRGKIRLRLGLSAGLANHQGSLRASFGIARGF
ncbi:MAG TPA: hypothetical protein VEI82_08020 [Myxococcota bacterium]|nr:hypothetical protein [Myxococcota bacterium]